MITEQKAMVRVNKFEIERKQSRGVELMKSLSILFQICGPQSLGVPYKPPLKAKPQNRI